MYEVGDRVRVIYNLETDVCYHDDVEVVREMIQYAGIDSEIIRDCGSGLYELSCDNGEWYWPEKTLSPYIETNYEKIHSMTDEQLARFLISVKNMFGEEYEGEMSYLDWLRREVEE